jgi:WD40 repeat protein
MSLPRPAMRVATGATAGLSLRYALEDQTGRVTRLAWSPDGRSLAVPTRDGGVRVHDAATGQPRLTLPRERDAVMGVAWSPDSRRLATISRARGVTMRDAGTGRMLHRAHDSAGTPTGVAWSPCGTRLAVTVEDPHGVVLLYDVGGSTIEPVASLALPGALHSAWDPTGTFVAVGTRDGRVERWDARRAAQVESLRPHREAVVHVAWSANGTGELLASASKDGSIGIRNPRLDGDRRILTGHRDHVIAVAIDPTARLLASKSRDDTVRLWRVGAWHVVAAIHEPSAEIGWSVGLAFHPGGRLLATLGEHDCVVRVWNVDHAALPIGPLTPREIGSLVMRSTPGAMPAEHRRVRLR